MKRIAVILVFSLIAALAVAAQEKPKADAKPADPKPAAGSPTADEIVDKYIKAIGGKEAAEKHTSRVVKGSFDLEAMNMSGDFELSAKAPNKTAVSINLPGFGVVNNTFDGTKGWSSNPMSGLRELTGAELEGAKTQADFYQSVNLKKHFQKLELKGKEKVGSSDAYVVEGTRASGGPVKLYFDATSGLLVRRDSEEETEQGKMAIESYFEDYREVDGVKIPFIVKQVNPQMTWVMKTKEVKHDVAIDDAKFGKPSGN